MLAHFGAREAKLETNLVPVLSRIDIATATATAGQQGVSNQEQTKTVKGRTSLDWQKKS